MLLADHTTLGVGGPAARSVVATTEDVLVETVTAADRSGEPVLLVGGGSNLLVADAGFPGVAVVVATTGLRWEPSGDRVLLTAAAGEVWDDVVTATVQRGLAGVEALAGIPGRVGATPLQNVGAYGQDLSHVVVSVDVLDRRTGERRTLAAAECGFGYRTSTFKRDPGCHVVLAVTVALRPGAASRGGPLGEPLRYAELARALGAEVGEHRPLRDVRATVLALRRSKGMVLDPADPDTRSAGSFFTNPVLTGPQRAAVARALAADPPSYAEGEDRWKVPAAWLIERSGFVKGDVPGPAGLSGKHVLAIVNRGGATAADVVAAARVVRDGVERACGIRLEPEPVLVGLAL